MIWIFNRDDRIVTVASNENPEALPILSASMHEVLNGDLNLEFEVPLDHAAAALIEEGFSAAVQRQSGAYELFIIDELQEIKESTQSILAVSCRHAVLELQDEVIDYLYFSYAQHADIVLPALLQGTRWTAGTIENTTTHELTVNKKTVLQALQTFIARWGGEVSYSFDIYSDTIQRRINFYQQLGQDAGRRFEFEKDLESLKRSVDSSGIKTALIGVGTKTTTDAEGKETRTDLLFTDIDSLDPLKPAGQDYVEDTEAREAWGYIMPDGTRRNRIAYYTNTEIEDPAVLLQEAWDLLQIIKKPKISYEVEVLDLAKIEGGNYKEVNLGDTARIIDDDLNIEIAARALEIKHDVLQPERTKILLDNFQEVFTDADIEDPSQRIDEIERQLGDKIEKGELIPKQWLEDEVRLLTERIRAGGGTVTINDDIGILIEEDPVNKQGGALKLIGGMLALANTYNAAQGDYDWRSFGTGDSFLSDLIETGFIKFDRAQGGTLTLGGEDNANGVMIVRNSIGEDIAQLSGDYGGFGKLKIDEITHAQNIVYTTFAGSENTSSTQRSIIYYVAANDGSDSNDGTSAYPLATVTEAISRLPKHLDHDVYIYVAPALLRENEILIEGFSGKGFIQIRIWRLTVRYIRDWLNGSTANNGNHWIEVKGVTEDGTRIHAGGVDGNINTNSLSSKTGIGIVSDNLADNVLSYWDGGSGNGAPVYVDAYLTASYSNVDSLYIWHYYGGTPPRTYHGTKVQVSADRSKYYTVFDSAREGEYQESATGKRIFMNKYYLKGRVYLRQNSIRVFIYDIVADGSDLSTYAVMANASMYLYILNGVVFGSDSVSYAVYFNNVPSARIDNTEINTASYAAVIAAYGTLAFIHNCKGSGFKYGYCAYGNASIAGGGTGVLGSTANTVTSYGGQIDGSWTHTAGDLVKATTTETTETWTSVDSHSWNEGINNWKTEDKDVLQGKWDTYGLYRGCWFFGSTMRNAVNTKTIKQIRVYITRANSSGSTSAVPIYLMPHGYASKPSYAPSLFTSNVQSVSLTRGQAAWVDCTDKFKALFENGSAYGIAIYTSSTSNSLYARCTTSCKVEITYLK